MATKKFHHNSTNQHLEIDTILEDDKENNLSSTMQGDSDKPVKSSFAISSSSQDKKAQTQAVGGCSSILSENSNVPNV